MRERIFFNKNLRILEILNLQQEVRINEICFNIFVFECDCEVFANHIWDKWQKKKAW